MAAREPSLGRRAALEELVERSGANLYFGPAEALERIERLGDLFAPALSVVQRLPGTAARD